MRTLLRYFLLVPLAAALSAPAIAQNTTRVAYVDASKLLKRMPEATDATTRLEQLVATWNHDADAMQSEIVRKQSEYDRRKLIMTDAERNAAEVDLQNVKKRLDDFRQSKYGPTGELTSQQTSLMKPAYDRLMKAIDESARDGNFDYVIDRSSKDVVLLYTNSKYDLTLSVARKLGIESDILSTPLVNQGPATQQPGQSPAPNPGVPPGTPPNSNPTSINPNQPPSFNSGSFNPGQVPEPPKSDPKPPTGH
jgi:outer membrane protein